MELSASTIVIIALAVLLTLVLIFFTGKGNKLIVNFAKQFGVTTSGVQAFEMRCKNLCMQADGNFNSTKASSSSKYPQNSVGFCNATINTTDVGGISGENCYDESGDRVNVSCKVDDIADGKVVLDENCCKNGNC